MDSKKAICVEYSTLDDFSDKVRMGYGSKQSFLEAYPPHKDCFNCFFLVATRTDTHAPDDMWGKTMAGKMGAERPQIMHEGGSMVYAIGVRNGLQVPVGRRPFTQDPSSEKPSDCVRLEGKEGKKSKVSKYHAYFNARHGQVSIVDAQSTNGTFINERRVRMETVLDDGDRVLFSEDEIVANFFTPGMMFDKIRGYRTERAIVP
jgi:hypothetical protein